MKFCMKNSIATGFILLKMMICAFISLKLFGGESFGFDGEYGAVNEYIDERELAKVKYQYFWKDIDEYEKARIARDKKDQRARDGLKNKKWTTQSGKVIIGLWESTQEVSNRYSKKRHYVIRVNGKMDGKPGKYDIDVRKLSQSCKEYVESAFRNNKYNDKDETERRIREANQDLDEQVYYINRLARKKYFELRDAKRVEDGWREYDGKLRSPEEISRLEEKKQEEKRKEKERADLISKGWHYENGKMYSPEEWRERDFVAQARGLIKRNSISGKVYFRVLKALDDCLLCIRLFPAYRDVYGDWNQEKFGENFIWMGASARTVADDESYYSDKCYWCGNYSFTDKNGLPTTLRMYTADYDLAIKSVRVSCKLYITGDNRFEKKKASGTG